MHQKRTLSFLFAVSLAFDALFAQAAADSLLHVFQQARSASEKTLAAEALFLYYRDISAPADSLSKYLHLHQQFAAESNNKVLWAKAQKNEGVFQMSRVNYQQALEAFSMARQTFHETGEIREEAYCITNLGNLFLIAGNYENSILLLTEAEPLAQKAGDKKTLAYIYITFSLNYMRMQSYQKAIDFGLKAIQYARSANATYEISAAYRALGFAYEGAKDYDNTERCHKESIRLVKTLNQPLKLGYALLGLADYYLETQHPDSALAYYRRTQQITTMPDTKALKCYLYTSLGNYYLSLNQPRQALAAADTAYALAEAIPMPANKLTALLNRAEALYLLDRPGAAYLLLKKAKSLQDSLVTDESKAKIEELRSSYLLDKQAREFEEETRLDQLKDQLLLAGVSIAAIFILLLLLFLRNKSRLAALLEAQKRLLTDQNIELEKANQVRNRLMSIISHDLRAPLYTGVSVLSRMEKEGPNITDISMLHRHCSSTIQFTENLLIWARGQGNQLGVHLSELDLSALLERTVDVFQFDCTEKHVKIISHVTANTIIWSDERLLHVLLTNLVSNAVSNAPSGTDIRVTL